MSDRWRSFIIWSSSSASRNKIPNSWSSSLSSQSTPIGAASTDQGNGCWLIIISFFRSSKRMKMIHYWCGLSRSGSRTVSSCVLSSRLHLVFSCHSRYCIRESWLFNISESLIWVHLLCLCAWPAKEKVRKEGDMVYLCGVRWAEKRVEMYWSYHQ